MSVQVYTNDLGSLVLTPRDARKAEGFAAGVQRACWKMHGDELVGVPEVELFNNAITQEWDERIQAEQRKQWWRRL